MNVTISRATAKGKKYKAVFEDEEGKKKKTIQFGAQKYQDYTQHHDPERKANYLSRHHSDPHSPMTAGELSRVVLWSKPGLAAGVREYARIHKMKVKLKL